jgi:hypothetical protein
LATAALKSKGLLYKFYLSMFEIALRQHKINHRCAQIRTDKNKYF